jgi:RNA recognition motif-containing protein
LQDAVPAALTKDKKQLDGEEITVHPDWQSTLYVTNFPEDYTAADLQQLFEAVSAFLEPSRLFICLKVIRSMALSSRSAGQARD